MSIAEKLTTIAENEPKIYDKGKSDMNLDWWNILTANNSRTNYGMAFARTGWVFDTFNPPYTLQPTGGIDYMFYMTTGLKALSDNSIDFSKVTSVTQFLSNSSIEYIGVFDGSSLTNADSVFYAATKLKTIGLFKINTQNITAPNMFAYCDSLEDIRVDGVLGKSSSLQWSFKLTSDSVKSMLMALADYSGTNSEYDYTITFASNVKSLVTQEGATAPNGLTWDEYVKSKGWNW